MVQLILQVSSFLIISQIVKTLNQSKYRISNSKDIIVYHGPSNRFSRSDPIYFEPVTLSTVTSKQTTIDPSLKNIFNRKIQNNKIKNF
jgi:hypothetical protein